MKYEELTDTQKQDIAIYDTYLRGILRDLMGVAVRADPESWNSFAAGNVDELTTQLDSETIIPNSTGLAGAKPLTAKEFITLQTMARGLIKLGMDSRAMIVKAVGVNAG